MHLGMPPYAEWLHALYLSTSLLSWSMWLPRRIELTQCLVVLCHHSPRWIFLTFRQVPLYSRCQPQSIYAALPSVNPGNQHSRPHHSFHPLYFQPILLPSELSHLWVTSSAHPQKPSSVMPVHQRGGLTLQFLSFMREAVKCDGNQDNG